MSELESGRRKREINGWSIAVGALIAAAAVFALCAALWGGSGSHVKRSYRDETLTGLCVIAAVAIWRKHDRDSSTRWRLVGGVGAVPVAFGIFWLFFAPKPPPKLHTEELPGFSIAVVDGPFERTVDDYAFGQAKADGPGLTFIQVLWAPGPLFAGDELLEGSKRLLRDDFGWKGVVPIAAEQRYRAGDLPVQSVQLLARGNRYQMTLVQCGERVVMPITGGRTYGGEVDLPALHRRVVASLRCTPEPIEERLVGKPPPVVVDLPAGWVRDDARANLVHEALFVGPENGALDLYVVRDGFDAAGIARGATYTVDQMSDEATTWTTPLAPTAAIGGRDSWAGALVADEVTFEVLAVTAPCLGRTMLAIYVGEPDFAAARTALASARCD